MITPWDLLERKSGDWSSIPAKYKCDVKGCDNPAVSYYDITITGIGDFIHHCANPEHEQIVIEAGQWVDKQRRNDYEERKAWNANYIPMPADEV